MIDDEQREGDKFVAEHAADFDAWDNIATLEELGAKTAQWLAGERAVCGEYAASRPDEETEDLLPDLIAYNLAGFATSSSQPGTPWDGTVTSRAFVTGLADEVTADRVASAASHAGLWVSVHHRPGPGRWPWTLKPRIHATRPRLLRPFDRRLARAWSPTPSGYAGLDTPRGRLVRRSVYLSILDPDWGRNDRLWTTLRHALRTDADTDDTVA